jgi:hypothetical protein
MMSMEVRNIKTMCVLLAIAGLMVALPVMSGEEPGWEDLSNSTDNVGYHPTVPERMFPPYNPPEPGFNGDPTLEPSEIHVTLQPGESFVEHKTLHMPEYPVPPKADIIFVIDLTGSMEEELENVKTSAIDIMTEIRNLVPDTYFGVVSHMDYNATYNFCQYNQQYGISGDYPYSLDQALTANMTDVQSAVNALVMGSGSDGPESYARALYECYADAGIGWRAGTKKFIVQFGDNIPHDCDVYSCIGQVTTSGRDPGRNGVLDDADDVFIMTVMSNLSANNICLIPLYSGTTANHFNSWDCWAGMTGCEAFQINDDGTVPGGIDIGDYIAQAIGQEFGHINTLTLLTCEPEWAPWLIDVVPPSYTDIELDTPQDFDFDIEIKVPPETEPGEYCFNICADGDGVTYARQLVCVTVPHGDDCIHLDIGEIWGNPGDDVLVPVYIQDVTGWDIYAFETMICWCELPVGLIQYEGCLPGEVLVGSGWGLPACGVCADNCVNVANAGAVPLQGGGVLFWLKFHISLNAKPGMCCDICFDHANVYDPEQPLEVCLDCGWVCIENCGIGGSVYTWWCDYDPCCGWYRWRPLPGARMHLSDCSGALMTEYTDANGEYFFGPLEPMDDCPYCVDIDFCPVPDALISAYDASLVLRYVVCDEDLADCPFEVCDDDQEPLSTETVYPQMVAANVNCSAEITAYDASLILQYVVGAIPAFPCPDAWAWYVVNGCGNCAPACPYDIDWVGVFIGDVSGVMPSALATADVATAKVGIPRHFEDRVEVPLLVEDVSDVYSIEFRLKYNAGDFAVVNVSPSGLASGFASAYNPQDGDLFIAMAGMSPIYGSGRVATITLQKLRPLVPTASPRVRLVEGGMFNEGNPEMVIQGSDTGREIWKISFEPASPNPFAEQTALRFSLPEASNVSLAVYNVNGQLVRMLQSGQVSAGTHQVMWDGRDDSGARVARGVYFCRMETAGFSATEKIVMLK